MSGLMSDPEKRGKLFAVVAKRQSIVSFALFVGGVCGFAALSHVEFAQKTYFSENALLPGVVDEMFSSSDRKMATDLISEASLYYGELAYDSEPILASWLVKKFESFGLECHQQNFTVSYPVHGASSHSVFYGTNVYGILRAPRSSGHEGLAIVAPIRTTGPYVQSNVAGVGVLLALAKFFSEKNFWARDIAFVVPALDMFGLQAWLNSYSALPPLDVTSTSTSAGSGFIKIQGDPLDARCGALQAALVLELGPTPSPPRLDLRLEGVNGLLPNLDYVNLVVRVAEKHGVTVSLQNRTDPKRPNTQDGFKYALITLLKQMGALAQFSPTGLHGLFLPLRIEALTLASEPPRPSKRMQAGAADLIAVGRLIEAVVRALNNLQERFHQSFFFYLLPCTHFFLSIGPYMGAFGAVLGAPLLHALALWISARSGGSTEAPAKVDPKDVPPVSPVWPFLITSLIAGAACFALVPQLWLISISIFGLTLSQGVVMSLSTLLLSLMVFLPRSPLFKKEWLQDKLVDWRLFKSVALLYITLALGAMSLLNISFAFFSSLLLIPTAVFAKPSANRLVRYIRLFFICGLGSPFSLVMLLCLIHPVAHPNSSVLDKIGVMLAKTLNDYYVHGCRFWMSFTLAYIPGWIFLYLIPFLPICDVPAKDDDVSDNGSTTEQDDKND